MAMPWRSPPERLATVESTVMPTPRKPIVALQDLVGDLLLLLDVDEAEAVGDLAADEEVAPERLLLGERLVLVDGLDRQIVRHADRIVGEVDLLVADEDAARGRREHAGHDLDQRRFAGAVVADQADDLVPADGEADVLERDHLAVLLPDFEQRTSGSWCGAGPGRLPAGRWRLGRMASGCRSDLRAITSHCPWSGFRRPC